MYATDCLDTFAAALQVTPLFLAVIGNCPVAAAVLLSQAWGADVNAKDPDVRQIRDIAAVSLACLAHAYLVPDIDIID